ncbi:peptide/nickel transport system ATP-binding protein [Limimonas halophila]|uniref:Peptide/nickel transport system ATP-binding protein n=1 Tax=Limimonas halophila TaxID=1082479 RepID=A0A1G7SZ86_9PROT|nr:ABC transporter ATP-binding protein [Limimonas halophila]SDG28182.1 peptide/nickel transport system ATP-binding protein [Limimonas halophila]
MSEPLLSVEDLRVRFRSLGTVRALVRGVHDPFIDAVCGVSFEVRAGETLGLVGESGSGKSTVARAIMGLTPSQEGSVRFEGRELRGMAARELRALRADMAMMFQDPVGSLSPRLTVRALITEPFRIHGRTDVDLDAEADRLLQMVGLTPDFGGRFPHQLSGGQARRVGVARALALNPKLIIADEPTAGLDVSVQGEVLNLLAHLQQELGLAILIITHNLNVVRHVTDRTAIMYLGRFVEQGETETIFRAPRHPYTAALLSANPEPDPDAEHARVELQGEVPSLMNRPSGCEFHPRCPYAQDRCARTAPPLTEAGGAHRYTCHFPLNAEAMAAE